MTHWSMSTIIDISPKSKRYGYLSFLLSGVSCTAYMREFISLLASMMQVTVSLLFLKELSFFPVTLQVIIACVTANP